MFGGTNTDPHKVFGRLGQVFSKGFYKMFFLQIEDGTSMKSKVMVSNYGL